MTRTVAQLGWIGGNAESSALDGDHNLRLKAPTSVPCTRIRSLAHHAQCSTSDQLVMIQPTLSNMHMFPVGLNELQKLPLLT
jgi:hypothetical protein